MVKMAIGAMDCVFVGRGCCMEFVSRYIPNLHIGEVEAAMPPKQGKRAAGMPRAKIFTTIDPRCHG